MCATGSTHFTLLNSITQKCFVKTLSYGASHCNFLQPPVTSSIPSGIRCCQSKGIHVQKLQPKHDLLQGLYFILAAIYQKQHFSLNFISKPHNHNCIDFKKSINLISGDSLKFVCFSSYLELLGRILFYSGTIELFSLSHFRE
jgi:hypothetical protein